MLINLVGVKNFMRWRRERLLFDCGYYDRMKNGYSGLLGEMREFLDGRIIMSTYKGGFDVW